jgi:hypothetical protein
MIAMSQVSQVEGRVAELLGDIMVHMPNQYYQPPHWSHEPTQSDLQEEEKYLLKCKKAERKVKEIAAEIYFILTGDKINQPASK